MVSSVTKKKIRPKSSRRGGDVIRVLWSIKEIPMNIGDKLNTVIAFVIYYQSGYEAKQGF